MTAEIGIMNKTAIALAADSAVTIGHTKKIYNSANKLFALSKYHPIGIMLFGSAEFMGIPWETVIKIYRKKLGKTRFTTVRDYANDFIKFLTENNTLIPEKEQLLHLKSTIESYFVKIKKDIKKEWDKAIHDKGKIDDNEINSIVSVTITKHFELWDKLSFLKTAKSEDKDNFIAKHKETVGEILKTVFEKLPLDEKASLQLQEIAANLFYKERFHSGSSGLVIAGFGESEIFPSLISFEIECFVENRLKFREQISQCIDFENTALIVPFAQSEMVHTFMEGIDPLLEQLSDGYLTEIFNKYPDVLFQGVSLKDEEKRKEILGNLTKTSIDLFSDFKAKIKQYRIEHHIIPIVNIVSVLPKDELAAMAEALVNLTSFKRKITMDAETVGGPIDVAIISKGDGFIWIKRKHYFKPELNPHFFENYFIEGVQHDEAS